MKSSGSSPIVTAFILRYLEDQERGSLLDLESYQKLFPGYEEEISREFERLGKEEAAEEGDLTPAIASLGPPSRIGVYKVLETLGEGGMGVVYAAEETGPLRRRVALKVIKLGMDTRDVLARFESERQALALMNHPHIARVLDAGATETGRPYFVMEHVPGIPLHQFCDRHRLGTRERLELFLQVCDAVQHAHQKGVIHRDLKPSNVLVSFEDGRVASKIIDFGVAKSIHKRLTEKTIYTEQGQIIGTPEYMSPEQAEMSALDIDTRTDIYSLGVILYELLTGVLPFDSRELRQAGYAEIRRRILEVEPPSPSSRLARLGEAARDLAAHRGLEVRSFLRQLRGDLDWIVLRAMEKDRNRRYASASELAADVRRHLRHEPVIAGPPGLSYRLWKLTLRRRRALVGLAVVLVLLTAAVFLSVHFSRKGAMEARTERAAVLHRKALAHWQTLDSLKKELAGLESQWKTSTEEHKGWEPIWDRADEMEAWRRLEEARQEIELHQDHAVEAFYLAMGLALPGSGQLRAIQMDLERLYFSRYQETQELGEVTLRPEFFRGLVESMGLGTFRRELEGGGRVSFQSDPPGAEVHCFAYQKREECLVPVPFDPVAGRGGVEAGLLEAPPLRVERVWRKGLAPFCEGDSLLEVSGRKVGEEGELARVLREAPEDSRFEVKVLRGGEPLLLSWVPFPAGSGDREPDKVGGSRERQRFLSFLGAFGFTLARFPLEFPARTRLGRTRSEAPLVADLPRGSYLFVFRKEGYLESRLPLAVPPDCEEKVRLFREEEVPPGFVSIPAGPVGYGGDREVDQSLPRGRSRLSAFFLARHEVTVEEYLEFVNDPEVLGRASGEEVSKATVMPTDSSGPLFERNEGTWRAGPRLKDPRWPILGITIAAGKEYAAWLTKKRGGRWRFRLPTDLEWEKAARGADRRFYVWGNYPVWSFCNSFRGGFPRSQPAPVGSHPRDESIFGVRDLAGSVQEPTSDFTVADFLSMRGGSWYQPTDYYFRIANRLGRRETVRGTDQGLRLAASLPEP